MVADTPTTVPLRAPGTLTQMANPTYAGAPPYTGAWKDAAYDPEKPGQLHSAEMVRIPPPLEEVVRLYTKAAIRAQPAGDAELLEWSAKWFAEKAAALAKG